MTITHHVGQVLDTVRELPDASVDLVATSPPFLALRNYNGLEGQWGSEATPAEFLDNQLLLATELRRVLTPHGSIAIELGDSYSGSGGAGGDYNAEGMRAGQEKFSGSAAKRRAAGVGDEYRPTRAGRGDGWPLSKSLCGIPTLYAWSLAYGHNLLNPVHTFESWRIRNVIIWSRNNPPVGALGDKYRPATSYITVACVSGKRWFDLDAVRQINNPDRVHEGSTPNRQRQGGSPRGVGTDSDPDYRPTAADRPWNSSGAPPLDHWHDEYDGDTEWLINTVGSSLAHYAMWPATLAERIILSMCPLEVCRECGEPRRRIDGGTKYVDAKGRPHEPQKWSSGIADKGAHSNKPDGRYSAIRLDGGWSDCGHNNYRPGVVLDPFYGTGTTGAVADLHGRDAIGIDLDPANEALHAARYDEVKKSLFDVKPPIEGQGDLLELIGGQA